MELLSANILSGPQNFSGVSRCAPGFFITPRNNRKNPVIFNISNSKFPLKSPFLTILSLPCRRNFQITAHLGRPSKRRNSLRKKLTDDIQQVRKNSFSFNTQNPSRSFDDIDELPVKPHDDCERESSVSYGDDGNTQESKLKLLGDSDLFSKLDNWVNQYKKDVEFWGVGSGPIFTVFQESDGNVERVSINEDEISRRCGQHFTELTEGNSKISRARSLAKEIEDGSYVLPTNSSIAKFVVSGRKYGFFGGIRSVTLQPDLFPKLSRVGIMILCGSFMFLAVRRLFTVREDGVEMTKLKKEMLRRKIKARMDREMSERGSVEVVKQFPELTAVSTKRPQLNKEELMISILNAKESEDKLAMRDSSSSHTMEPMELDTKIEEIREMARCARKMEADSSLVDMNDEEEEVEQPQKVAVNFLHNLTSGDSKVTRGCNGVLNSKSLEDQKSGCNGFFSEATSVDNGDMLTPSSSSMIKIPDMRNSTSLALKDGDFSLSMPDALKVSQSSNVSQLSLPESSSTRAKPRVIRSVEEAREYLSEIHDKREPIQEPLVRTMPANGTDLSLPNQQLGSNTKPRLDAGQKVFEPYTLDGTSDITTAVTACQHSTVEKKEFIMTKIDDLENVEEGYSAGVSQSPNCQGNHSGKDLGPSVRKETWMEKNFQEFEPIVKKIGIGFTDNYAVARHKVNQELTEISNVSLLRSIEEDDKLEWMKDDSLREIVFQVRENELAGCDPFYSMDAEDKLAFFKGLEMKVEKENEKLLKVHELIHSNIENIDYGTDGISLYDPPEKIIPRWKGPLVDKDPDFLNNFLEQRKAFAVGNAGLSHPATKDQQGSLQKSEENPSNKNIATSSTAYNPKIKLHDGAFKTLKTVIESSDGSVRAGKKSGKEYWQHTKKWSREFLEVYNTESDPEIKSIMKDMGKDLDRWITEKEIEEAADLMNKIPKRNNEFIEKRINKLKREMELFGPQAVVSKYQEYAEEKEEDYLWWLDLPHVMCIELYTNENGDQKIGFYSLEMAADLELNPKQYHVIAFEDPADCKNLCYIIQAHMDMLGNGHAFVIAQPPKDAFREAKANGFNVTVIRKGELQLNVDQMLEEVEEQITEIGTKIYHDKVMRERSVDISSMMKGVFGSSKPTRRKRSKRKLKKLAKHKRN